jgi:2-polyprenyl-3-methyl-5-hydroxy-6-metoxy-1,4-benzoquinol methylase
MKSIEILTERQRREREYYGQFVKRRPRPNPKFVFATEFGSKHRPWNSYWHVHDLIKKSYTGGARTLLDFGCGAGHRTMPYAKMGFDVHGFDVSAENIELANDLAREHHAEHRTHYSVQTAESTDYPAEFFDIVVGFNILHHVEVGPAVQEAIRVLKRGGVAIFREHVEVPVLDRLRNTKLIRALVPNTVSFDSHITEDERKLTAADLAVMRSLASGMTVERFTLCARLTHPLRPILQRKLKLDRIDHFLFRLCPPLRALGGSCVIVLTK